MARHYAEGQDPKARIAVGVTAACVLALLLPLAFVACEEVQDANEWEAVATYNGRLYPGQPLDMIRVSAPSWSDYPYAEKIVDRTSGACWWRVHIDGEWATLLVSEGSSYVKQQQETPAKGGE